MSDIDERPPMTLGRALRAIAERTSFRTEAEGREVLECIDQHIADEEREPVDENEDQGDENQPPAGPADETKTSTTPRTRAAAKR